MACQDAKKKYDEEYEDSEDDEDDEEQGGGGAGDIEMKGNPMGYTNVKRWSIKNTRKSTKN